ncbi:MAG: SpoVG family protein [Lachnospiraceae bacterium]|nr:SpoVG family protein [Lachnospiraceae bacterium]
MQVTEVRLKKSSSEDSCLAYGSVTFDADFVVCGIRVFKNNKDGGLFVGFPCRQNQRGEYKDICFPMTSDLRENITVEVLAEYEKL